MGFGDGLGSGTNLCSPRANKQATARLVTRLTTCILFFDAEKASFDNESCISTVCRQVVVAGCSKEKLQVHLTAVIYVVSACDTRYRNLAVNTVHLLYRTCQCDEHVAAVHLPALHQG
jgi:hypothetical protein